LAAVVKIPDQIYPVPRQKHLDGAVGAGHRWTVDNQYMAIPTANAGYPDKSQDQIMAESKSNQAMAEAARVLAQAGEDQKLAPSKIISALERIADALERLADAKS
jgi:hypothetical protein